MKNKPITFLTFQGKAEAAMNHYVEIFDNCEIIDIKRYGKNESGETGSVMHATFTLNGSEFMCIDSNVEHEWTFTPAVSIYINCESENEIDQLFQKLSEGGKVFMELDTYDFSQKYAWVADRFGVSWQLNLEKN